MRLYKVTHNDGSWHSGDLPSELILASNPGDTYAALVKFPGYEITVTKK